MCNWFLLCENEPTGTLFSPVLGDVLICDRCRKKVEDIESSNVRMEDPRLEKLRVLHFRNAEGRCAECASTHPCKTVRIIDPEPSVWDQIKG